MSHPKAIALAQSHLFQHRSEHLSCDERIKLSYDRAKAIAQVYNLTAEDLLTLSPTYWEFHTDPILAMDGAAATLLTIHYNLCAGTLAMFSSGRPEILITLQDILAFRTSGQYCLTELGHGLDVFHLETTATLLPDGNFELNTPTESAAKYMPPTTPCGIPCVAVVFARLVVEGEDRGVKPFLVPLHDGAHMYEGVVSKPLSPRGGSRLVKHALTYFRRVQLGPNALLGEISKAGNRRARFFQDIARVISGTLSMGAFAISAMRIGSYIAGRYSMRRMVTDAATGVQRPIITFSTQSIPVLTAVSQTLVMEAFAQDSYARYTDPVNDLNRKHFIATTFKATIVKHTQNSLLALGDRCGAQGLFEVNQLSVLHADMRGAAIAEGDTLTISIRFAIDLLLGRVAIPDYLNPDGILAKHEQSLIAHLRGLMAQFSGHRDPRLEYILLPQCQPLVEAIGHRLAYEAAVKRGIDDRVVNLYVASVVEMDPAWYVEHAGMSRWSQQVQMLDAAAALRPDLERLLVQLGVEDYVTAPITSDEDWNTYVGSLEAFGDSTVYSPTRNGAKCNPRV
ncbi:acyl-CoA dehydrogenase NM domain-like protein [Artomyces pyxidatus]|uniref:Acyl-CoA dehydrogenase NM domain-like protein n=1 Tax=Artomyces pyxidatus TaxID=48021 RepID=A0ACB8TCT2_9AGAM|nr:acyl-CoA dehydrogenase NM domain-like protein [Artomyces pyxidatus]